MTQPSTRQDENLWHEDHPPERMMALLLRRLLQSQSMDEDQAARFCLTPAELAGLLPVDVKAGHAQYTAESLASFLDEQGEPASLAGAIRDWKVSIELIRSRFGWLELPPALRKRAHQRARALLQMGRERGWLEQQDQRWRLTPRGNIAAQDVPE